MILKLCLHSRHNIDPGEGADHPTKRECFVQKLEIRELILIKIFSLLSWPDKKEDDLDAADDGEPSEEPHGASNETQLGLRLDLLVSLDVVKGRRVKVDLHQMNSRLYLLTWNIIGKWTKCSGQMSLSKLWKLIGRFEWGSYYLHIIRKQISINIVKLDH